MMYCMYVFVPAGRAFVMLLSALWPKMTHVASGHLQLGRVPKIHKNVQIHTSLMSYILIHNLGMEVGAWYLLEAEPFTYILLGSRTL